LSVAFLLYVESCISKGVDKEMIHGFIEVCPRGYAGFRGCFYGRGVTRGARGFGDSEVTLLFALDLRRSVGTVNFAAAGVAVSQALRRHVASAEELLENSRRVAADTEGNIAKILFCSAAETAANNRHGRPSFLFPPIL
jgi:hypothetical protein